LPTTRTKIETAASDSQLATPAAGPGFTPYFEWHGKVLYQHPAALQALCEQHGTLRQEYRADNTDPTHLHWLLAGNLAPLFASVPVATAWQMWRYDLPTPHSGFYERARIITDASLLPATLAEFQAQL
jgi:hypothetical protein